PADALARLEGGGILRVETSWPFSSDYALANKLIDERDRRSEAERSVITRAIEGIQREVAAEVGRGRRMERRLASLDQTSLLHQIDRLATRVELLERRRTWSWLLRLSRKELLPASYEFDLAPGPKLDSIGEGRWTARDGDPYFRLRPRGKGLPAGWVLLELDLE